MSIFHEFHAHQFLDQEERKGNLQPPEVYAWAAGQMVRSAIGNIRKGRDLSASKDLRAARILQSASQLLQESKIINR